MHSEDLYQQRFRSYSRSQLGLTELVAVVEQAFEGAVEQPLVADLAFEPELQELAFEQELQELQELVSGTVVLLSVQKLQELFGKQDKDPEDQRT